MAKCKYPNEVCSNMTVLNGETYCGSVPCIFKDELPKQTNADRIRNMTDEDLAIFINSARCDALYGSECEQPYCEGMCGNSCNDEKHIDKHLLQWLQAEVEEG